MKDLDRQAKLEADAIHDGIVRYSQSREYQLATDSRPVRDLIGNSLKSLADAILQEQVALKTSERPKLPKYGTPLLAINHEKLALITLGTLLNAISRSEFDEGLEPRITSVAYEIGQRCRLERIFDRLRRRHVNVAQDLLSRNRSRHARRRAEELARKLDDDDDWAKNFRSHHLGEKLIALAVEFAYFDGQPVFELRTVREGYDKRTKTTHKVALTTAASDWIGSHEAALASLPNPVYTPMIMPPRPWTSLSGGGYLLTPLNLLKRKANRRAQQLLETADLAVVFSAVNALQSTAYRINKDIYRTMRSAWDAGNLVFGLRTHAPEQLPPRLPDDADPTEIEERKQERADAFNLNNRIKGFRKVMAFRLSLAERLLDEPRFYFPYQLDHRGRAYPVPQLWTAPATDTSISAPWDAIRSADAQQTWFRPRPPRTFIRKSPMPSAGVSSATPKTPERAIEMKPGNCRKKSIVRSSSTRR
jgi:DNA-directed RNA polymerase